MFYVCMIKIGNLVILSFTLTIILVQIFHIVEKIIELK